MNIKIKDIKVLESVLIHGFDKKLIAILSWLLKLKKKIVITGGYRPKQHRNDLHGQIPVRAIDIRSWIYLKPQKLADKINFAWIYDSTRPNMKVAIYHKIKNGAWHLHIQVCARTRQR